MITSKQRAYLRSLAHSIEPNIYVGKLGLTPNVIRQADEYLGVHELIKGSVQQNIELPASEAATTIADALQAEIVQVIGRKFVLYRRNPEEPKIVLPS